MADPTLGTATLRTRVDTAGLQTGLRSAETDVRRFGSITGAQLQSAARVGATAVAGITTAAVAAGTALIGAANKAAQYADEVDKAALRTRLSTDTVQELRFVTDQLGGSFATIESAVEGFTRRLAGAEQGGERQIEAFTRLGIAVRDASGQLRSQEDILFDSLSALSGVTNQTEQAVLAQELFGRSAAQLGPLLAAGAGSIDELRQKARDLGLVMDRESVTSLVAYKDQLSAVQQQFGAVTREVALGFLPILTESLLPALQTAISVFRGLPEPLQRSITGLTALGAAGTAAAASLRLLGISTAALFGPAGLIIAGVSTIAVLVASLTGNRDSLEKSVQRASTALAGGGPGTMVGALDAVIAKVDGPTRDSLQRLRDDLVTTGDLGVQQAERIKEALAEAVVAPLRAERAQLASEIATIERLLSFERNVSDAQARREAIEREFNPILDAGGSVPFEITRELTQLDLIIAGAGNSAAELARQESNLARARERLAALDARIAEQLNSRDATPRPTPTPTPTPVPTPSGAGGAGVLPTITGDGLRYTSEQLLEIFRGQFARLDRDVADRLAAQQGGIIREGLPQATAAVFATSDALTQAIVDIELRRIRLRDPLVAARLAAQQGGAALPSTGTSPTGLITPPTSDVAAANLRLDAEARFAAALAESRSDAALAAWVERNDAAFEQAVRSSRVVQTLETRARLEAIAAAEAAEANRQLASFSDTLERLAQAGRAADVNQRAIAAVRADPFAGVSRIPGDQRGRSAAADAEALADRSNRGGSVAQEAFRQSALRQEEAGKKFREEVVKAGLQFATNLSSAIRSGDPGGIFGAATSGIGSIIGLANPLAGTIFSLVGGLFAGLIPGASQGREDAQRAAGAAARGAPAIEFNVNVQQSLSVQSLTDPASRSAVDGLLTDTVQRIESVLTAFGTRLKSVEARLA